jgi:hypothetical protein
MKSIGKKRNPDIPSIKRMLLLICMLFVLVKTHALTTGDDSTHSTKEIGVLTGVCTLSSIDELYSFQKYSGSNAFIGMTVGINSAKSSHCLHLMYSGMTRNPQVSPSSSILNEERNKELESTIMNLDYRYLRKIYAHQWNIFVSANWINRLNFTKGYKPEMVLSSFAPGLAVDYTRKRLSLGLQVALPVVSLTLRNAYHISHVQTNGDYNEQQYIKDNLRVQSLHELKMVEAQLTYRYLISNRLYLDAQYHFSYISDSEPRKLRSASGIYGIGLTCNF